MHIWQCANPIRWIEQSKDTNFYPMNDFDKLFPSYSPDLSVFLLDILRPIAYSLHEPARASLIYDALACNRFLCNYMNNAKIDYDDATRLILASSEQLYIDYVCCDCHPSPDPSYNASLKNYIKQLEQYFKKSDLKLLADKKQLPSYFADACQEIYNKTPRDINELYVAETNLTCWFGAVADEVVQQVLIILYLNYIADRVK